jgi:diadenosine tetraphosphate (Ap4A) HIT family hydrolase
MVMARMRSGFAVIGDTQHLPGYSVLLYEDSSVHHLTELTPGRRGEFLLDLALLGEAVETVCRGRGLRRMNYEVLGNAMPWLHGHVHARYEWEPPERLERPVWSYPDEERDSPEHSYSDAKHGALRAGIAADLRRLMRRDYA